MKRAMAMLALASLLAVMPVFAATENTVDKDQWVKDDFAFRPETTFSILSVEERHANEFSGATASFRLRLNNASLFEAGKGPDGSVIAADATLMNPLTDLTIRQIGEKELEITLDRSTTPVGQKAWWRIPIYAEVEGAGPVTVEVDGRDGPVTSGTYEIARVPGSNYLSAGYQFTPENQQWMTLKEPTANAFAGKHTFRLVLENGSWFSSGDSRLGVKAMQQKAEVSGVEGAVVSELRRIDDATLEVLIDRGAQGSVKAQGVWSLPLYFKVDTFGEVKVKVDAMSSAVKTGALSDSAVKEPLRYIRTVTLTLNQPEIQMKQGNQQNTVHLDQPPVNPAGSSMIPVRGVFEQLGGTVVWNDSYRTVTVSADGKTILLHADSDAAMVDGKVVTLPARPMILNGRLLIPLRAVSEQLGYGVQWNEATQQITIRQD